MVCVCVCGVGGSELSLQQALTTGAGALVKW